MESSLSRKRKADEIDDEYDIDKVWGIVTDAEKWYFMECTFDNGRKAVFKLSKPLSVAYEDEDMKDKAEKVLGHIIWLLKEARKPVKALEESREIKRARSGDLVGKGTSSTQTNYDHR
ncbi:hypothetical protein C1645_746052 [Glomus cerebriforme]|uniref:Uncharacterized protein n=1 Tax=Glomus cerebriforme TaxID=658196 RepID=A0A397SA65_9GLOM|nr:hypothetical protein C1645_746052 [Glomus cerebriforme]